MTRAAHICPACRTAHAPELTICPNCGLISGSAPLPNLQTALAAAAQPRLLEPTASLVPKSPLQAGQQLMEGRYTVQRLLSVGGMGAVALATDHSAFERPVVVKVMLDYFDPAQPHEAAEARARFTQEARTLAQLHHPSIPQIYAFGQDGPRSYLVMEYVKGDTLERGLTLRDSQGRVVQSGQPYPLEQVLGWGVALCRLLEYLGGQSPAPVVHQDIKPANLLLDRNSGEVRLVDFGTAQAVGAQRGAGYGTPGYAPPEQYKGQSEPRSDVYALAATLYHLLTDDDPRDHPFQFPRLQSLGDVGALLERALCPDVDERPGASELRSKLSALLEEQRLGLIRAPDGTMLTSREALVAWCERHWNEAAAWLQQDLPDQLARRWNQTQFAQQLRGLARRLQGQPNAALDAALALLDPLDFGNAPPQIDVRPLLVDFGTLKRPVKAERTLLLRNTGRRAIDLRLDLPDWIDRLDSLEDKLPLAPGQQLPIELVAMPHQDEVRASQTIDCYHDQRLVLQVPVRCRAAEEPRRTQRAKLGLGLGLLLALWLLLTPILAPTQRRASLKQTAGPPAATVGPAAPVWDAVFSADISPDGQLMARADASDIELIRTSDNRVVHTLDGHREPISWLGFSPDGTLLASCSPGGLINIWEVRSWRPLQPIASDIRPVYLAWSPDSARLAERGEGGEVVIRGVEDRALRIDIPLSKQPNALIWAPDGQTLTLVDPEHYEVRNAQNGARVRYMLTGGRVVISPDNQLVAVENATTIDIRRLSTNAPVRQLQKNGRSFTALAFSNNGALLAAATQDGNTVFWAVGRDAQATSRHLTTLRTLRFSPDGKTLIGVNTARQVQLFPVVEP